MNVFIRNIRHVKGAIHADLFEADTRVQTISATLDYIITAIKTRGWTLVADPAPGENALLWEELKLKRPLAEYMARSDTRNWLKREAPQEIHLFMGMRDALREYDKARGVDSDEE